MRQQERFIECVSTVSSTRERVEQYLLDRIQDASCFVSLVSATHRQLDLDHIPGPNNHTGSCDLQHDYGSGKPAATRQPDESSLLVYPDNQADDPHYVHHPNEPGHLFGTRFWRDEPIPMLRDLQNLGTSPITPTINQDQSYTLRLEKKWRACQRALNG